MPLRGKGHSDLVRDEAPYFGTLADLDAWFSQSHDRLSAVLPYQPRPHISGRSDGRPRLLVCHDYKGGYTESPSGLCYTFNFWPLCDTFVYFSHHRITIPPSGWTNAAHKHGTKMLGTLIFEGPLSVPDCLQLIIGRTGYVVADDKIPVSKHYATLLAELAYQRGFDGYLLNFEFDLPYKSENARALGSWILLLRAELQAKVGSHAEVVWYDSVTYDGSVHYQNRLNGYNLPFFLASDALFTNYWWKPKTQVSMAQYFENLLRSVPGRSNLTSAPSTSTKTLQSIYSGVDVWPNRGQYGDSGYCCYRAITHTAPLGFSTALFAPGWTWESATDHPEQNWNHWWAIERRFWLGPLKPGDVILVPPSPEGTFKPMTAFFQPLPPPNPSGSVFYTNFSPGVGYSWFIEGKKVLDTRDGWTDIDKQTSIGNLVWPWPTPAWDGAEQDEALPIGSTALDMTDGYNGGNTLEVTLTYTESEPEDSVKFIWLPVQSLTVTTHESFEVQVVYKTAAGTGVDCEIHLDAKSLADKNDDSVVSIVGQTIDLPQGWTREVIHFMSTSTKDTVSFAIGFRLVIVSTDLSTKPTFSISLGQLAVYPTPPPEAVSVGTASVTDATFSPALHAAADVHEGVLTWDTASTFTPTNVHVGDGESVVPAWLVQDTPAYRFPAFVYFNIYAAPLHSPANNADPSANAAFVGTTGLDGRANRFYVDQACLPAGWEKHAGLRFYVQGVTDRGEVLPWKRCATVDHWVTGRPRTSLTATLAQKILSH